MLSSQVHAMHEFRQFSQQALEQRWLQHTATAQLTVFDYAVFCDGCCRGGPRRPKWMLITSQFL
jgi:hypothetical protein